MILYIVLLLATTAAAFLVKKPDKVLAAGSSRGYVNRISLCGIFLMLFAVSACRYQVGNDYPRYEEYFYNIWNGYIVPTEWGFNRVIKLLEFLFGEENYLLLFAFFAMITVFFMLKALYELSSNFVFSFYLFMAFGYYFQSMNTIRYYFAASVALYAITFLMRRKYGKFVLAIVLASLIHKSVLIVIPIYLLANCNWRRWQVIIVSLLASSGFLFGDVYLKMILYLYPTYRNTIYLDGGTSYVNIARCVAVLAFCLLYYGPVIRDSRQLMFYFRLNIGALMILVCGAFLPEVSRIATYMTITQVFLIPGVISGITDKKQKRIMTGITAITGVIYFAAFLYKAYGATVKLLPYHTWLF